MSFPVFISNKELQYFDSNQSTSMTPKKTWTSYFSSQAYKSLNKDLQKAVLDTRNAIGCIITNDGQFNGSALLIAPALILVPKHCVPGEIGNIQFTILTSLIHAKTIIDREIDAPFEFRGD